MAIYVYTSKMAQTDAQTHGFVTELEKITKNVERGQSLAIFQHYPVPYLKKALGKSYRLIASRHNFKDDIILVMLRILSRGSSEYSDFMDDNSVMEAFTPSHDELIAYLAQRNLRPVIVKPAVNDTDLQFLYGVLNNSDEGRSIFVYESKVWVEKINSPEIEPYKSVICDAICSLVNDPSLLDDEENFIRQGSGTGIKILCKKFPYDNALVLIAPLKDGEPEKQYLYDYEQIFKAEKLTDELKQFAIKSYPLYLVVDKEIWFSVEKDFGSDSRSANLSLSPEEVSLLESINPVNPVCFPLFINGRPGSGKSTILQYLYADYLKHYLIHLSENATYNPPIYLTYSQDLLNDAKKHVINIVKNHYKNLVTNHSISPESIESIDSMMLFQDFLLRNIPDDVKRIKFKKESKFYFRDFKVFYKEFRKGDGSLKSITPEIAWHVIRTYIKGMTSSEEVFSLDDYEELPKKRRSVSSEIFKLIHDKVYQNYIDHLDQNNLWDDQDIAQYVLINDLIKDYYPAIFCDEAQDFTKIELEVINRFSVYHHKKLQSHEIPKVPVAFAGDPFQTLNPTGFKWESVKDLFRESLILANDTTNSDNYDFNYKPLSYNYRSTPSIVKLCNLILLVRASLFNDSDVKPQIPWGGSQDSIPKYFNICEGWVGEKFASQPDITYILPCDEGEENDYIKNDSFLKTLQNPQSMSKGVFLSAILSKGLQFSRVVLYKFSEQLEDKYNLKQIFSNQSLAGGDLTLEYFFNKLYVAASRPFKHLFILEAGHIQENPLWGFLTDLNKDFFEKYTRDKDWLDEIENNPPSISIRPEGDSTFDIDAGKEDPKEVAEQLFTYAMSEQNPAIFLLAAPRFKACNQNIKASLCEGYAMKFQGEFLKAGDIFKRISDFKLALQCYWKAIAYEQIAGMDSTDKFTRTDLRFISSKFYCNDNADPLDFIKTFTEHVGDDDSIMQDPGYIKIINIVLERLFNSPKTSIDPKYFHLFEKFDNPERPFEQKKMAHFALKSGLKRNAFELFRKYNPVNEPEYITLLTEFGSTKEKIDAHFKRQEFDKIVEIVSKSGIEIPIDVFDQVFTSFIALEKLEKACDLIDSKLIASHDPGISIVILNKYKEIIELYLKLGRASLTNDVVVKYIQAKLDEDMWKDVTDILRKKKLVFSDKKELTIEDQLYEKILKIYLVAVVRSDAFLLEKTTLLEKKDVIDFLSELVKPKNFIDGYSIQEQKIIGAALEMTGDKFIAGDFYKRFIIKETGITFIDLEYFRSRWLKAREKVVDHFRTRGKTPELMKTLKEISDRKTEWNIINFDKVPEYPNFEFQTLQEFIEGIPVNKISRTDKKDKYKVIRLLEVAKNKDAKKLAERVAIKINKRVSHVNVKYFTDRMKLVLDFSEDSVTFLLKDLMCESSGWEKTSPDIWQNEEWQFNIRLFHDRFQFIQKDNFTILMEVVLV
jgi:hypothetical protein